jgi:hypothetical protein
MNSCRYPEVAKNSALFQKLVAGEQSASEPAYHRADESANLAILLKCNLILTRSARRQPPRTPCIRGARDIGTWETIGPHLCAADLLVAAPNYDAPYRGCTDIERRQ